MNAIRSAGLVVGASAMLAALFVSAGRSPIRAAGQAAAETQSQSKIPKRCVNRNVARGTLRVRFHFPVRTLNPYQGGFATYYLLFDDFFRWDEKGRLYPMMATGIPTPKNGGIKDGGRTILIRLKRGLRWSNGSEITSADVKFGWRVAMDKATGPLCADTCDVVTRIDTPDRYTAVLRLKRAYPQLLEPFSGGSMWLPWPTTWPGVWNGDPHAAALKLTQDPSFNFFTSKFPTSGPYQPTRATTGGNIALGPMKYYSNMTCGAFIKKLMLVVYPSVPAALAAASAGKFDVGVGWFPAQLAELRRQSGAYRLHVVPGFTFEHLEFNLDRRYKDRSNPLANTKVRLALALALDKIGLIRSTLLDDPRAARNLVAWTPWVNTPTLVQPFADRQVRGQWDPLARKYVTATGKGQALADARKLLGSTPWKDGFELDFYTTEDDSLRPAIQSVVAAQWARLGVRVNRYQVSSDSLFNDWDAGGILDHGAFQVSLFAFGGGPDPDPLRTNIQSRYIDREQSVHSPSNQNFSGIRDAAIDRAFNRAGHTFRHDVRLRNYSIVQRRLNQGAYWVPLYFTPNITTTTGRVANYRATVIFGSSLWNAYAWKVRK